MAQDHDIRTAIMLEYIKVNFNTSCMSIWADLKELTNPEEELAYVNNRTLSAYPDLRAIDEFNNPKIHIIGEAKTRSDYLKRHIEAETQMDVYINVLKTKECPFLIYSVPAIIHNRVYCDLKNKIDYWNAQNIKFKVLYK